MIPWLIVLNKLIVAYFAVVLPFYGLLILAALWSSARYRRTLKNRAFQQFRRSALTPPVSILVPTYNEELSAAETVRSLLRLDYPELEVVVINDGSRDDTLGVLRREFSLVPTRLAGRPEIPCSPIRELYVSSEEPRLLVIDKKNGGKSDALNAGLNFARSPYFCTVDADVVLESDALLRVMAPVLDSRALVIASGGIVRVANGCQIERGKVRQVSLPRKGVEVLQVVEYLRGFLFGREAWSALQALLIISGAFGVFSRRVALEIGGYRRDTVGEDMDLVVRMHCHLREAGQPYRILFVPDPVCWTEVPSDFRTLVRQRARWQKGLLDVLWRHRRMLFNPRYGRPGLLGFPYQVMVELLGPVIELVGLASILASTFVGLLSQGAMLYLLLFGYLAGTIISVAAVLLEELTYRRYASFLDLLRLLAYTFLDFFPYRQFLILCRIWGMVDYFRRPHSWGAQQRKGFAPQTVAH
ncbi:MAG: glycosyltransferase family 2 protein [Acidobacteria bacterium]|nr:glycosyltransferase family 2 protein [Acidobacteriota bacterium]